MNFQDKINSLYKEYPELAESVLCFICEVPFIENRTIEQLLTALRNAAEIHNDTIRKYFH